MGPGFLTTLSLLLFASAGLPGGLCRGVLDCFPGPSALGCAFFPKLLLNQAKGSRWSGCHPFHLTQQVLLSLFYTRETRGPGKSGHSNPTEASPARLGTLASPPSPTYFGPLSIQGRLSRDLMSLSLPTAGTKLFRSSRRVGDRDHPCT